MEGGREKERRGTVDGPSEEGQEKLKAKNGARAWH
jgi:hypothetical protein